MPSTSAWRLRDTLTAAALFLATAAFTLWQNTRVAVLWDLSFLLDTSYRWGLGQLPYKNLPFAHSPLTFLLHTAIRTIKSAGKSIPIAVVMLKANVDKMEAVRRLAKSDGNVRLAIDDSRLEL